MRKYTLCAVLAALFLLFPARAAAAESAPGETASPAAAGTAAPDTEGLHVSQSTSRVAVDGFLVAPEGYCINQENYYKLRDLAFLLTGKITAFDVVWDDEHQCISMISGQDYTVAGGEMAPSGNADIYKFVPSYSEVRLDGQIVQMTGYNINNNNYYRIRDVGPLVGFGVDWDNDNSTVVIDSKSGVIAPPAAMFPGEEPYGTDAAEPGDDSADASGDGGSDTAGDSSEPTVPDGSADPTGAEEPTEPVYPWIGPKIDGVLTILLDPGHGGTDIGSYNPTTKQNENTTNLTVANYLKEMLESAGVRVIMSRESTSTTLRGTDRKDYFRSICEQGELDLLFSIHHNGFTSHTARGTEVYVQASGLSPEAGTEGKTDPSIASKALGDKLMQTYMSMGNGLTNRGVKETSTLYMVYTSGEYGIPAVLSEYCFIDNAEDVKLIDEPHELQAEAKAMFDAIMAFYQTTPY